jgi:hypothetical protein
MKNFSFYKKVGYAVILAAFVFAGCEQAALDTLSGEAIALNAAKAVSKVTVPPTTWGDFSPLPFTGISNIRSVSGLGTDGTQLVAATYDGTTAYVSRYNTVSGRWSNPQSLAPYGLTINPGAVHFIGRYFMVTGGSSTINGVYSPDGVKWSQTGNIGFGSKAGIYGPAEEIYVVAGQNGQAAYSADPGFDFTVIPQTVTGWSGTGGNAYINAGAYGAGRYVFGGGSGRIAYTDSILKSSDDNPWSTASTPTLASNDFINVIAYGGNNTFVAAGNTNANAGILLYSINGGVDWDPISGLQVLATTIYALAYGDGYFVAVNNNGDVAYSQDGYTWVGATTTITTPISRVNAAVFYDATNTFFAAGGDASSLRIIESN